MARRPTRTQEPTTRSARGVTSTPGQPRIRDFTRAPEPIVVDFDVRTVFDFVFSLSDDAGSTDDLPLADRRWLAEGKTALRETVGDALELYASDLCIVLAGLAVGRPDVRRAA